MVWDGVRFWILNGDSRGSPKGALDPRMLDCIEANYPKVSSNWRNLRFPDRGEAQWYVEVHVLFTDFGVLASLAARFAWSSSRRRRFFVCQNWSQKTHVEYFGSVGTDIARIGIGSLMLSMLAAVA